MHTTYNTLFDGLLIPDINTAISVKLLVPEVRAL
jgi:hypothetical protein